MVNTHTPARTGDTLDAQWALDNALSIATCSSSHTVPKRLCLRASTDMPALYHGLLPRVVPPFVLPSLSANQRGLVLGMGGGCDGFAAFALAQKWGSAVEGPVLYGNCIGQRAMPDDHEQIADHLWCGPAEPRALAPGDEAYGSTRLELSIPRGVDGSPLLFVVPRHTGPVAEASAENQVALCGALRAMRIDSVVAVDLGGDSLTGGIDFKGSDPEMGRDRQVCGEREDRRGARQQCLEACVHARRLLSGWLMLSWRVGGGRG